MLKKEVFCMIMSKPELEFVHIDVSDIVTYPSTCTDGATGCTDPEAKQDASVLLCDCTNTVNEDVTQDCTIV